MRKLTAAVIGLTSVLGGSSAFADTLATPPGLYFGSGNSNSGFTVSTTNGVEVGLSAILRYSGVITPTGDVYNAPTGLGPGGGAKWGVDFSINLAGAGLTLNDITTVFQMTDVRTGAVTSFNALTIPDNAEVGTGGATCPYGVNPNVDPGHGSCTVANAYGAQNSEPVNYLLVPGGWTDPGYDMFDAGQYIFDLTVTNKNTGGFLATDEIVVNAPEPISLSLFGAGLAGLAGMKRRRKVKA